MMRFKIHPAAAERYPVLYTGIEEVVAIAGVVATVAGTAVSISAAQADAAAKAAAERSNSEIMQRNAIVANQQASANALEQQRATQQRLGAVAAAYGAAGVEGGSTSDVLAMSAANGELSRQNIIYEGNMKAAGYTTQAQLDTGAASTALTQGNEKATGAALSGLASLQGQAKGLLSSGSSDSGAGATGDAAKALFAAGQG